MANCIICKKEYKKNGRSLACSKECAEKRAVAVRAEWHKKHPESLKMAMKKYRIKNIEKFKAKGKKYYREHKEELAEYAKRYLEKNKDTIVAQRKKHREENIEIYRERENRYKKKNRELINKKNREAYAKRKLNRG